MTVSAEYRQARPGAVVYDAEDYLEEFSELTDLGMSCREIVARSAPSLTWFRQHIFPHAPRALCIICHGYFTPAQITRGTECGSACRNAYTGFGKCGIR
jgi:hypothetical protein